MRKFNVAVVGATGAVGEEIFRILEEKKFPINNLLPLASKNSVGKKIKLLGKTYRVKELNEDVFEKEEIDIAFFSAGGNISKKFCPIVASFGAVVIDNSSYFRMDSDVPLVVPEVNPKDIEAWKTKGIIANPNCSTIQMVLSLKPIDDLYGIKRVDVSTYQAASGAGKKGMEELVIQMQDFFAFKLSDSKKEAFAHQIALNVIPHIDIPQVNGYTKEEMKMINESQKILHKNFEISATCVRVPVLRSHSESISVTFEDGIDIDIDRVKEALNNFKNVEVMDDLPNALYPMPIVATDTDTTYVGRIRKDIYKSNILHFFNAADQLRVGAATNAVRIALKWIKLEQ